MAAPVLKDDTFFMTFDFAGKPITVGRSPSGRNRIRVEGDFREWPTQPDINKKTGEVTVTVGVWTDILGRLLIGLPPQSQIPTGSYLTFNACIAYFLHRSRDGAFAHWTVTHTSQSHNRVAVPLSFLFGLDTDIALQFLRADESAKAAAELRRAIKQGLLATALGSSSQVRSLALLTCH